MPQQRKTFAWITVALLLSLLIGVAVFQRAPQFHPYVTFQVSDALKIAFLQHAQSTRSQCEATTTRMVQAMLASCSACRVLEIRCLEKLDPRQSKIYHGQPVDIPVMHLPDGTVAFIANTPELALNVCKESERQTARALPGIVQCNSASSESIALSLASVSGKTDAMPKLGVVLSMILLPMAISLIFGYLIIRFDHLHARFSYDLTTAGPQKFHAVSTPRIGGVPIAAAVAGSVLALRALDWPRTEAAEGLAMLALAAIPAFAGGFAEDVTKRFGVQARLMLTIAAGGVASLLVGATLDRLDIPGFDSLLLWPFFAIAFTAFAVGGVANAINIIDGYNGLAGGYAVLVLAALAWIAAQVGDLVVLAASLTMLGALLGFLVWNYPSGKIFLGDGGAYLVGFWLAELSVLLVARNPDVSPWFSLLLLAYPVFETLFSIYRRKILHGQSPGLPDALHLHQLIYVRLARVTAGSKNAREIIFHNNMVAPYIWVGSALFIAPSLFLWRNTLALMAGTLLFCLGYVWLYFRLMR